MPTMTPQQTGVLNQLLGGLGGQKGGQPGALGMGMQNLSQLLSGSPEAFQAFEAPMMRQFKEQTIPSLAERFSSFGQGAQQSSAFGQQMGQAGAGLSENLGAMRGQLQQNAMSQLMQLLGIGTGTRTFENIYQPASSSPGLFQSLAPALGMGLGMGAGGGLSNWLGGLMGGKKT